MIELTILVADKNFLITLLILLFLPFFAVFSVFLFILNPCLVNQAICYMNCLYSVTSQELKKLPISEKKLILLYSKFTLICLCDKPCIISQKWNTE